MEMILELLKSFGYGIVAAVFVTIFLFYNDFKKKKKEEKYLEEKKEENK